MIANQRAKLYFPNLNGLRFIAAFFVIINHVEQLKRFYGTGSEVLPQFAKIIGKLGVMMFFVLSGFLITYLLLSEEKIAKKIHLKKFYWRRFLRIAPLYFLMLIATFIVFNTVQFFTIPGMHNPITDNFLPIVILHVLFLPNVATAVYGFIPYIAQAWSIGTEEQSYILWPLLLKKFSKNRITLMMLLIVVYVLIRFLLSEKFPFHIPNREILSQFWWHFNIDAIAVGGLFAVLLFKKSPLLKGLLNTRIFVITTFFTLLLLSFGVRIPVFHYLGYSFLFGIIIVNLAANKQLKNTLEWSVLKYLGTISYGIYMYHFPIMIFAIVIGLQLNIENSWFVYAITILGSIGISSVSYHYFERFFLKLKVKYTVLKSGGSKF